MENLAFSTKYRSKSIDEYVGNDYSKSKMLNAIEEDVIPPVWLIHGESGCGKTTLARLGAKHIVCENKQTKEINGRAYKVPCNECTTCVEMDHFINTGDSSNLYNVTELDSSKTRKVETIEAFIEEAGVSSMYNGYEVYILDECHLLTTSSQSALLKFTEDTPEGKVFMFCTTDKQKMLPALVNRAQVQCPIEKPSVENIISVLANICDQEGLAYERQALSMIAIHSDNVYRSSQLNLEEVARLKEGISVEAVSKALDIQDLSVFFDFFRYLSTNNIVMFTNSLYQIKTGIGFTKFINQLTSFVVRGLYLRSGVSVEGLSPKEIKNMKELFKNFSLEEIIALLNFLRTVEVGNVEANLFTLGYQGLGIFSTKAETHTQPDPIPNLNLKSDDLEREKQVLSADKKHQKEVHVNKTSQNAEDELRDLSEDDIMRAFGI